MILAAPRPRTPMVWSVAESFGFVVYDRIHERTERFVDGDVTRLVF